MTTAGELLAAEIGRLAADLTARRAGALSDEPDAVHQLRTTVRRLRNVLAAFRRCFDPDRSAELAAALASYGDLLGECRDLEVRAADVTAALDALGLADARGDALGEALVGPLLVRHAAAHAALVGWHAGPGVRALDALLATWTESPALARRARRPAAGVATKAVRRQARRVLARADAVVAAEGVEEARHGLRKAGRRLRHTADAVASVDVDGSLRVLGGLGHRVQGALGDHRDALLLAEHVRRCAAGQADRADRASYELVAGHAEKLAAEALAGLDETLSALRAEVIP
ncbi:CHAD domain-containing protein [Nocardioides aromaticivorans]|uniref:CHAD domain-containing protein n=1 Tax=Nocardioides aromaticivorans TaxID=200618 RepID=A0A7Y9ZHG1_9ACTN|nr:CHAD domain-containing protein [Nocardioides aromaticivorans]NYI43481.1 CHAD domain-containing protein [Nocardioides aromaticivorans]